MCNILRTGNGFYYCLRRRGYRVIFRAGQIDAVLKMAHRRCMAANPWGMGRCIPNYRRISAQYFGTNIS